jgi:Protein of unknown function (DUF2934)
MPGRVKPLRPILVLGSGSTSRSGRRRSSRYGTLHAATIVKITLTLWEQDFSLAGTCNASSKEKPMQNLDEAIRQRAYQLWIADGQPDGQADLYWLNAQREVLTTSLESSSNDTAVAAPADSVSVTAKPAKKARVARSGRSKARAA